MNLTVQRFIVLISSVLVILFSLIFGYFYIVQQEKTASVILKSIYSTLSETSYVLSKNIHSEDNAVVTRPLLDRVAANNDFIDAVLIHNSDKVLVTTNPNKDKILRSGLEYDEDMSAYNYIMGLDVVETTINYYEADKSKSLKLSFILDKSEIDIYLTKDQKDYIIYFGLIPFLSFVLVWYIIKIFVVKPLESLRQFAYYQHHIPNILPLKELEIIRYSMVQTFQTLENEKKELYAMARTDSLSGLANRNSLNEFLERLIANSARDSREFALLFLDLDHFKDINDSLGHNVGDELLKKVASIIDQVLRSTDFVARVGGDEFVIVVQDYNSLMELIGVVERIQEHLAQTWIIQTYPVKINCSIGISFYPKDGDDIVSLMKNSDIAMYEAKAKGRGRYHFFTEELNSRVQSTINLDKNIRKALEKHEYELYYQVKVDSLTNEMVGVEALVRWIDENKKIISPDIFIPLAEENGFILELGCWILEEAIRQHKSWKDQGYDIRVSINISSKQILQENFLQNIIDLLNRYEVDPSRIDLEITEYMFIEQSSKNNTILQELQNIGITISLDDFGTGYSSLSYLKKFPIDYLKIDKSFIDDYNTEDGAVFIDTIVKMGHALNMKIIAEGVEIKEQVEYLKDIGCDQLQGYYFSKPIDHEEFEKAYLN